LDVYGNCCTGAKSNGICVPASSTNPVTGNPINWQAARFRTITCTAADDYLCPVKGTLTLYCVTKSDNNTPIVYYEDYSEYACGIYKGGGFDEDAVWILVDTNGNYINPELNKEVPRMFYRTLNETTGHAACCQYEYDTDNGWHWNGNCSSEVGTNPTTEEFLIEYTNTNTVQNCSL
jgi:hypothetical protein